MIEQVFIIRVWQEASGAGDGSPEFRGMIKHAPSGEKRYLENLNVVDEFMLPYLKEMGIDAPGFTFVNNSQQAH